MDELDVRNYHLFKFDSEGIETRGLAGAVNTIDKNRCFLYFENNNRLSSPAPTKQILSLAYLAHWNVILYYRPDNYRMFPENIFSAPVQLNLFGVFIVLNVDVSCLPVAPGPAHLMQDDIADNKFTIMILFLLLKDFGGDIRTV